MVTRVCSPRRCLRIRLPVGHGDGDARLGDSPSPCLANAIMLMAFADGDMRLGDGERDSWDAAYIDLYGDYPYNLIGGFDALVDLPVYPVAFDRPL
jgi:hypothetical protein